MAATAALAIATLSAWHSTAARAAPRGCQLSAGPTRTVVEAIDGATLRLDDGSAVRLANLSVPRGARDQATGGDPAQAALEAVALKADARLWFDTARTDRYGMLRAHVMIADRWLQAVLLETGVARVDARLGERACVAPLLTAEAKAREAGSGIWRESAFRVRSALPARDLGLYRGTFQIVRGEVVRVETARDIVRLILGQDRHAAFTVSMRANDRELSTPLGGDLRALMGRSIEARGIIGSRPTGGPDMDVSLAGDVRLAP